MADSAPDPKVEDVLSSVRRLVSQEIPKRETPKPMASDDGALVLTSQDRVEADPKARYDTRSLEERIAELEAAVDNSSSEFEPDGSEDQAQHRPDRIVFTRPRPDAEVRRRRTTLRLSEIALIETGPANESEEAAAAQVAFRHEPSRHRTKDDEKKAEGVKKAEDAKDDVTSAVPEVASVTEEAPMAEDVPTLPASPAELRAFSDDPDDVVARIEARIEQGSDGSVSPPPERIVSKPSSTPDDDESFTAALTAAIAASKVGSSIEDSDAAAETDVNAAADALPLQAPEEKSNAAELDVSGPAGATRRAQLVRDAAISSGPVNPKPAAEPEAPDIPQPEAVSASLAADEKTDVAPAESATPQDEATAEKTPAAAAEAALDALADEDALRLLVGRLMREELQGKLGERMTRNIRKLVQREVKRVMETRSLD